MNTLVIILISVIFGILFGYGLRSIFLKLQANSIEKQAKTKLEDAEVERNRILREADIQARTEIVERMESFEESCKKRLNSLQERDDRLSVREEDLERKLRLFEEKSDALTEAGEEQANEAIAIEEKTALLNQREHEIVSELQKIALMTQEEARIELRNKVKESLKAECAALIKKYTEEVKNEANNRAADLVGYAIKRYALAHASEDTAEIIHLPSPEVKGCIIGREGRNARAIEAATGVSLIIDNSPDTIVITCFDPVRREIAKLALTSLINDGRIHPQSIESQVEKAKADFELSMLDAGNQACADLGLDGVANEIVTKLGRLKFRLSFGQNVLLHSIEVAHLMGSMADELNLDGKLARRIGLFHDIGKALPDTEEGSHARLGADLLRRFDEDPALVNAVAAHHEEVDAKSIYAALCIAADAISSGRPGARSGVSKLYFERIKKLEDVAKKHKGVQSVIAMQAGHELRVIVNPETISESEAVILARDIAKDIEAGIKYPGQIRITVIREQRCVTYAR